jgi:hypothetical protein
MAQTIQFKRGNEANLPTLDAGEPAVTLDTERMFIGGPNGNIELLKSDNVAVNVKATGAKSDGTDSTQAFIKAREKSKYIFVPEGTFVINDLSLQDVVLFGNGTLKWKDGSTTKMIELKGRSVVDGLTFDGNGINQTTSNAAILLTTADKSTIKDNLFTNFRGKLIVSDVALSSNVQVLNNRFENCGTIAGCDVVTVRSSDWLINGNHFSTIGDGHCIRLGLYNGDATTPVERTIISDNHFKDTQHVGVTCEIYTRNVLISNNTFENLEQAVKCEPAGGTVYDITISNNIIRNITLPTALNLGVTKVKFTGNKCYNMLGGADFGDYFDCSHNEFYDCGTTNVSVISVIGSPLNGVIIGNVIVNPFFRGISVFAGIIHGNRVIGGTGIGIRASQNAIVTSNYINGGATGINLLSTATRCMVNSNIILGATSNAISSTSTDPSVIIGQNVLS